MCRIGRSGGRSLDCAAMFGQVQDPEARSRRRVVKDLADQGVAEYGDNNLKVTMSIFLVSRVKQAVNNYMSFEALDSASWMTCDVISSVTFRQDIEVP